MEETLNIVKNGPNFLDPIKNNNDEFYNEKQNYENLKNKEVFIIKELKSKVYKTSIGVLPFRNRYNLIFYLILNIVNICYQT